MPAVSLGLQMRVARKEARLTLRELARRLGVSPSFLSQIENGKSQPSVATLYAMAQVLKVSIDDLFTAEGSTATSREMSGVKVMSRSEQESLGESTPDMASVLNEASQLRQEGGISGVSETAARRADLGSLSAVWQDASDVARLSVTTPGKRTRLVMDTGVVWEQLATNTAHQLDFIEILYPPGASSISDQRMLRHHGFEYGYLLEGELEVTLGFETFVLHAGQAMGLNSSIPHLFRNPGDTPARGIWFVHHDHT